MVFFNLGLTLIASGDASAALREYANGARLCAGLPPEQSRDQIAGALTDLEELVHRWTDLLPAVTAARETIGVTGSGEE